MDLILDCNDFSPEQVKRILKWYSANQLELISWMEGVVGEDETDGEFELGAAAEFRNEFRATLRQALEAKRKELEVVR